MMRVQISRPREEVDRLIPCCSHWNERKRRLHLVAGDSLHFEVRVAGKRDKMFSFPLKGYMLEEESGGPNEKGGDSMHAEVLERI